MRLDKGCKFRVRKTNTQVRETEGIFVPVTLECISLKLSEVFIPEVVEQRGCPEKTKVSEKEADEVGDGCHKKI
ncbi:hypothetical protein D8674_000987 [Pyrus ussuriensis x Pyrus communis]|uniref:Uncharacterized protein n=1 Tax=Pyrus ussuriensis x Pyrus communis TaxID=2448454 RepID=A0A5N5F523_9ROSA|nr:hypothetical protein D8674_000987 [Pyrus ussuriensis x Pyrus communis]